MKRKRKRKLTTLGLSIISLLFLTVGMITPFLNQMNNNSPVQATFIPTPTHELFEGEQILQVAEGMPNDFDNNLRISGGSVWVQEVSDENGQARIELRMALGIRDNHLEVYEGFEWDYENYHFRVLEIVLIGERGYSVLAISQNR